MSHTYSLIYFISSISFIVTGTLAIISEDYRAEVKVRSFSLISLHLQRHITGLDAAAWGCASCLHDLPGPAGRQQAAEEDTAAARCDDHQATREIERRLHF